MGIKSQATGIWHCDSFVQTITSASAVWKSIPAGKAIAIASEFGSPKQDLAAGRGVSISIRSALPAVGIIADADTRFDPGGIQSDGVVGGIRKHNYIGWAIQIIATARA